MTPDEQTPQDATPLTGVMADLVVYQAGSVVSRVILKQGTGNVTVFAFDRGQGLSEHTTPFDALVHILDGAAEITVGGTPHDLRAGEMILMPASIPHALKANERFKMALTMIRA
jgi:quercetin dioxygenase-like cupin family protein